MSISVNNGDVITLEGGTLIEWHSGAAVITSIAINGEFKNVKSVYNQLGQCTYIKPPWPHRVRLARSPERP